MDVVLLAWFAISPPVGFWGSPLAGTAWYDRTTPVTLARMTPIALLPYSRRLTNGTNNRVI